MIAVSNEFKTAMKQPVKELQAYVNDIRSENDLISFKIGCESGLCKTAMRKLEAKYTGEHNLLGQWVRVGYGVKLADGTFEYLDYGSFLVSEITTVKDTGITTIIGYDKMINSMKPYQTLDVEYPVDLFTYTQKLCEACSLELGNESFTTHNDWLINQELWENIDGITYRDILVQIAQVTASTCIISNDDKVYFKPLTDTGEVLTYDNMFKLKLEPKYGEINSVVLARTPQEDNIYMRDEDSIKTNGLTEFKIENNEIIDKDRDNAMTPIYNALKGISYYPFEATTEGLGWYEIGDKLDIINDTGDLFNTSLFNLSINIDGSIKETLKTVAETKTQTQYQYATTIAKRVKNTEIIVNKQEQYIEQLVSDMYEENGVINENFTKIEQNVSEIVNGVQNSGGNNLIKNSVMFAYDSDGNPNDWDLYDDPFNLYNVNDVLQNQASSVDDDNWITIECDNSDSSFNSSRAYFTSPLDTLNTSDEYKLVVEIKAVEGAGKLIACNNNYGQFRDLYEYDFSNLSAGQILVLPLSLGTNYQNDTLLLGTSAYFTAGQSGSITFRLSLLKNNTDVNEDNFVYQESGDGKIIITSNVESLNAGCLSGHSFTLLDKLATQKISVNTESYYTFSTRIKKSITGTCYVKLYNSNEEYIIKLASGEEAYYKAYELKALLPKDNYYIVEFYGSSDSDATFTDNMLALGEYKSQWTQANGEIMNTQVNVNLNGVLVKSSVYLGDYTVMSPLEFAGYSNINGTITKVFSLNKDTTNVKKLEAEDEVKMVPIKIVPITSGDLQGWAFVPSTKEV